MPHLRTTNPDAKTPRCTAKRIVVLVVLAAVWFGKKRKMTTVEEEGRDITNVAQARFSCIPQETVAHLHTLLLGEGHNVSVGDLVNARATTTTLKPNGAHACAQDATLCV